MNDKKPLHAAARARSRRRIRTGRTVLATAVAALFAATASAEVMRIEPAIGADVTLSNNGNQAPPGQAEADLALEVRPEFWLSYQTSRLRAYGLLGATATTFIGGSRTGTVYPSINLGGTLQAIRNFFFVDADMVASRQFANPFAPRSSAGDQNSYTSYNYRLAPYLQGELPSWGLRYLLRNDFYWTTSSGEPGIQFNDGFESRTWGEVATTGTRRLGLALQYNRDYLKYREEGDFTVEVARAIASYHVTSALSLNVRGGYEWQVFPLSEGQGSIYGGGFAWRPSLRTDVSAWWEHRFFGSSWDATVSYRVPWFAVSAGSSRLLSSGTQNLFSIPRTNNVFRSLDAILSSRVPDPVERTRAVRDLLTLTGLPSALATPVPVYSQRINVQESNSVSIGLLGARNSLVADAYYLRQSGISAEGEPLPPVLQLFTDETQLGASVTASHRLARADSLNLTQLWQRTEGSTVFNSNAQSTQWTTRLQYNHQIQPRTTAYGGVRYINYTSNVFPGFTETAIFVGLYHRFH